MHASWVNYSTVSESDWLTYHQSWRYVSYLSLSHVYNGQRECTGWVSGRDRVTRDKGRCMTDSTVSESD